MKTEGDPMLVALVNTFGGGLLLLPIIGIPSFEGLTPSVAILLLAANVFWALQTYFFIKSLHYNDVVVSTLLECGRFVLLFLAGILIFSEPCTLQDGAGAALICASILFGTSLRRLGITKGTLTSAASVLCGACALICDKGLTNYVDSNLVILAGFFLPGVMFLAVRPNCLAACRELPGSGWLFLALSTALMSVTSYHLISGFAAGELGVSMTIYQSYMVLNFVFGLVLLGETQNWMRRLIGCFLCLLGIALVSL
jgi:drug/metabolite transporter (DMT)-like permease